MNKDNKMREVKIEKITLNIGVGNAPEKLERGVKLLEMITKEKVIRIKTTKRIPTWGLRPNLAIGCKVTLRGAKAEVLLKRMLNAVENKIKPESFDKEGNFSFGIRESIDIPDLEYNAEVGIMGLDVIVTLYRPGFRIKRRKYKKANIPLRNRISKEEAIEFLKKRFDIKLKEEE